MQIVFTDFKRFNKTHFWSESKQEWLHQDADKHLNKIGDWLNEPYKGAGNNLIVGSKIFFFVIF